MRIAAGTVLIELPVHAAHLSGPASTPVATGRLGPPDGLDSGYLAADGNGEPTQEALLASSQEQQERNYEEYLKQEQKWQEYQQQLAQWSSQRQSGQQAQTPEQLPELTQQRPDVSPNKHHVAPTVSEEPGSDDPATGVHLSS